MNIQLITHNHAMLEVPEIAGLQLRKTSEIYKIRNG